MPRVPTAFYPRAGPSPALGAGVVPRGAQELAEVTNRGLRLIGGTLIAQGRERLVLEARTAGLRALNDAQLAAQDPNVPPEDMQRVFEESFQSGLAEAKSQLGDFQSYGPRLEGELQYAAEARRMGLAGEQRKREAEYRIAGLETHLNEVARAVALAPTSRAAHEARQEYIDSIRGSTDLSPVDQERWIRKADETFDANAASGLLETNPAALAHVASTPQSWSEAFPALDEQARYRALDSVRIEMNRRETEYRQAKQRAEDDAISGYLKRFGAAQAGVSGVSFPTAAQITADPRLTGPSQLQLLEIADKTAQGLQAKRNSVRATDLYLRVHDPTRPDHIDNFAQVLPYVNMGSIDLPTAEAIRSDIDQLKKDPAAAERDQRLNEWLRTTKSQFTVPNGTITPIVSERYNSLLYEARRRWTEAEQKGQDPIALFLDPDSPESFTKLLDQYRLTQPEIMKSRMDWMRQNASPTPGEGLQRREGESEADYLKRRGLE